MAQYEVRYDIQVINAANAAAQINAFATACNKLAGVGTELKTAAKGVTDLKAALAGFKNT